jgi:hypothetical protein
LICSFWHQAQFSSAVLFQCITYTSQSVPRREIAPVAQMRKEHAKLWKLS